MKLQAKLLLVVVPLIVLPLLTLGWVGYSRLRDTSTERMLKEVSTLLDQLSQQVQVTLRTAQANAELFSGSALLHRYVLTASEAERYNLLQPTLNNLFRSYQKAYPSYYEIRLLLPDGYEDTRLTRGAITNVTEEEGDTPYFRKLQESPQDLYFSFFHNPDNHRISLLASKKLRLRDPSADPIAAEPILRGYLAITVDLGFLEQEVKKNRIGDSGYIFFTGADGTLLFHPKVADHGQRLLPDTFAAMRQAVEQGMVLNTVFEGEAVFLSGRRLHDELFLFASLPQRELLTASRELGWLVAGIIVVTILLSAALMLTSLRYLLVNRVRRLSEAAREIGRGNLLVPIEVKARDEIGGLARSFAEMAQNLAHSNAKIRQLAFHDGLTGLPNRVMFREYLDDALARAARTGKNLALLFLDFDNFKWINDTLGHERGDEFLKEMAQRIGKVLRREDALTRGDCTPWEDMVSRLGGDEFIVLLQDLNTAYDAGRVAERLLAALAQPLLLAAHDYRVTGSIGITVYPDDGTDGDVLIKNADIAMYQAKQSGKNTYAYYSDSMKHAALQRVRVENRLRRALENNGFTLHYQPQLDAANGRLLGFEALLRWQDEELGWVPPDSFIPLAEETGLILPITAWVLKQACRQNKFMQESVGGRFTIAVNVSGVDVNRGRVGEVVAQVLEETGLDPELLVVELTETALLSAQDKAVATLRNLKTLGIKIVLDDFGTGYSSLNYLRRFPIDGLKIDRSFLANLPSNPDDTAIVSTIIAIAHTLRLTVTAEGVENREQLEFLKRAGCDTVQGFLFSPALPPQDLPELMRDLGKRFATPALPLPDLMSAVADR